MCESVPKYWRLKGRVFRGKLTSFRDREYAVNVLYCRGNLRWLISSVRCKPGCCSRNRAAAPRAFCLPSRPGRGEILLQKRGFSLRSSFFLLHGGCLLLCLSCARCLFNYLWMYYYCTRLPLPGEIIPRLCSVHMSSNAFTKLGKMLTIFSPSQYMGFPFCLYRPKPPNNLHTM